MFSITFVPPLLANGAGQPSSTSALLSSRSRSAPSILFTAMPVLVSSRMHLSSGVLGAHFGSDVAPQVCIAVFSRSIKRGSRSLSAGLRVRQRSTQTMETEGKVPQMLPAAAGQSSLILSLPRRSWPCLP